MPAWRTEFLAITFLLCFSISNGVPIELLSRIIDPISSPTLLKRVSHREQHSNQQERLFLIQAHGRVTEDFRMLVAKTLSREAILHYVPQDTLLVKSSWNSVQSLSTLPQVHQKKGVKTKLIIIRFIGSVSMKLSTKFRQDFFNMSTQRILLD